MGFGCEWNVPFDVLEFCVFSPRLEYEGIAIRISIWFYSNHRRYELERNVLLTHAGSPGYIALDCTRQSVGPRLWRAIIEDLPR